MVDNRRGLAQANGVAHAIENGLGVVGLYHEVFGDLYQMLLDGKVDLLAGLAWKEDRANLIGYPEAPMGSETYSLVKHDTDASITADPSTLSGKRIGVLNSAVSDALDAFLVEHHVTADVVEFADYEDLFAAFDSGKLDVLAAEGDGAYGRDHAEVLMPFGSSDYYLCTNIARADLLDELNAAQTVLAAEEPNYLTTLRAKYYSSSVTARAFSADEREWLQTHDSLRVGYLENYLPYSDTSASGEVTGLVADIVPKILESLGIADKKVTYRGFASYEDMIAAVRSGDTDVAFPVGGGMYYAEESGIYQTTPIVSTATNLVFTGEFNEQTTSKFAVNENNRMQYYYVQANYPDAEVVLYPSIDDCLHAVLDGQATCTTLNGLRANAMLRNRAYKHLSMRQATKSDDRCFGVVIGNKGLLKLLNRGISVVGSEYAQSLSDRYTSGLYSYGLLDMVLDNMCGRLWHGRHHLGRGHHRAARARHASPEARDRGEGGSPPATRAKEPRAGGEQAGAFGRAHGRRARQQRKDHFPQQHEPRHTHAHERHRGLYRTGRIAH
ncbi:MAG: transporter substrate-binding domain-containing protein [Coriobacteriales bacterium]|nr:transporter substrate-binding domain-containing protein [Coriobacteriales bacterium]